MMIGDIPFPVHGKYTIFRARNGRWVIIAPYITVVMYEDSFKDAINKMDMHAMDMLEVA